VTVVRGIWVSAIEFGGTPLEAVIRAIAVCDQIEEEFVGVRTANSAGKRRGFVPSPSASSPATTTCCRSLPIVEFAS